MADLARVLNLIRRFSPPRANVGLLSVEIFLHCAQHPEGLDYASLVNLCEASHGPISRAAKALTVVWDKKTGTVQRPSIHLLQRRKRRTDSGRTAYWLFLTTSGRALMEEAAAPQDIPGV
jgi:hypothetical protein